MITPLRWLAGLLMVFSISGCVTGSEKATAPVKSVKPSEDRSILIVDRMRQEAVSRRVGRWAVVVGISDYRYDTRWNPRKGIPDLKYAHRDAKAFADFLLSPEGGAFSPDHVRLLVDQKATTSEVRVAIGDFLARSLEDDLVIIFFAGHGTPDPKNPQNLYLLCHDTQPGKYYGTALPMWEIDVALNRTIRSKKVFVLADACHSAGVGGTRTKSSADRFNDYLEKLAISKEGITKITASRSDELSQERLFAEGGHGVFTYYLLQGLRGEADDNLDGFVTMKEAFDYLYDRVRSDTRHSQNPWASAYVSGDIPLGISDSQVLAAIKARVGARKEPSPAGKINQPPPASVDLPEDSAVAVKLARAKFAKNELGIAREMVEGILVRNDSSKPEALAVKIAILLREGDLKGAEDTEDLLVIPYPDHPAAQKGAGLVYQHYLEQTSTAGASEQIRQVGSYLKRHPAGLLEREAKKKLEEIRAGVRTRYQKGFKESLTLTQGFISQKRFERARKELDNAEASAREALSNYGITLDTNQIAKFRLKSENEERQYQHKKAYQDSKAKASKQSLAEKIKTWENFVVVNPTNPYVNDAKKELSVLRTKAQIQLQIKFDRLLSEAKMALQGKDFARALEKLDAAATLLHSATDELDISINERDLSPTRERHRSEAAKHQDFLAWSKADSEAKTVRLNDTADYDRRISIYEDFQEKWPDNPYRTNAKGVLFNLKQEKTDFMDRKFNQFLGKARERFIGEDYRAAYASLAKAKNYATLGQLQVLDDLARRYNAPPEVRIVLKDDAVDWESPVIFRFEASDKEDDPVRVISWDFGDGTFAREDKPRHTYAKWDGLQKERQYVVTLKATDGHSAVTVQKTLIVKKQDRIKTFTVNGVSFKMIRIPAGKFTMGSPSHERRRDNDERQHGVTLTKAFWMGETEVTQGLWKAVMGSNPSYFKGDDLPVEQVSWNDIQEFIRKLNRTGSGNRYRLPTEAEWEYAARAGSTTRFSFGDDEGRLGDYAWYRGNSGKRTHRVAQKKPNNWGFYDMHGNVWEWVQDWQGDYPSGSVIDPKGPSNGSYRVLRGGCWLNGARRCRSAYRLGSRPVFRDYFLGFRLVLLPGH